MSRRGKRTPPHKPTSYGSGGAIDNKILRATVHGAGTLATSGIGALFFAISLDPSTLTGTDWADFSSTYDEFRVTGVTFQFYCAAPNSVTLNNSMVAIAFDNDSSVVPTTFSQVRQYANSRVFSALMNHNKGLPFAVTYWRPVAGAETPILWSDVATPATSVGSLQIGCTGLTVSTDYLYYTADYYLEFRGRR